MKNIARIGAGIMVVLATAGIASAQMGGEKAKGPDMAAHKAHVYASLTGLDKTNAPKVEEALKAIQFKNAEGISIPAIASSKVNLEKNSLSISVAPGASLRLSEIEKALEPTKVKLDRNSLGLETACVVKVTAKAEADDSAVKDAITDAKLFESFDVKPTKEASTLEVNVTKTSGKATCGEFTKAIAGAGEYALADVTWTCPAAKMEKPPAEGGKQPPAPKPQG